MTSRVSQFAPFRAVLTGVLALALIGLLYRSFVVFRHYSSGGQLTPRYPFHHFLNPRSDAYHQQTPFVLTVDTIQPWMTFDYLNRSFHLSPDYLKQSLHIQDKRYPNLSLQRLAADSKTPVSQIFIALQTALKGYSASSTVQTP